MSRSASSARSSATASRSTSASERCSSTVFELRERVDLEAGRRMLGSRGFGELLRGDPAQSAVADTVNLAGA